MEDYLPFHRHPHAPALECAGAGVPALQQMPSRSPAFLLPTLLVSAAAAIALCGCKGGSGDAKAAAKPQPVPVVSTRVERRAVPVVLTAVGNVEPIASVAVRARVDGEIVSAPVRDGQDVSRDQVLFQLDPRPFETLVAQAEAALAKDQAQREYLKGQAARYDDLLARHFISEDAQIQVRANYLAAEASVRADEAALANAKLQLSYTTIRAPLAGRVGRISVAAGNLVKANDTAALVTINQIAPIYATFAVPEQYGRELRERIAKGAMPVRAQPRDTGAQGVDGRLAFIDNAVDPGTGTIKLRAEFVNRERVLWPGDFVEVRLQLRDEPDAVVVGSRAVQTGPNGSYVWLIGTDGTVATREVVVGRTVGDLVVVAKGLAGGEQVVADGASRLLPGAPVQVKPDAAS